ncbi:beta-ketoacyl-[acyl-carrier-protein] synthase family protein [soil metagenome]
MSDPGRRRVAITGLGCVSGLGQGLAANWAAAVEARGAIHRIARRFADDEALAWSGPAAICAPLDAQPLTADLGPRALSNLDPQAAFAVTATHEALAQAGLIGHPVLNERTAVVYGGGSGGNLSVEEGYGRLLHKRAGGVHPLTVPKSMLSATPSHISMLFGIRGTVFALSSACASGAHAISEAMWMIRSGRCEAAICGGSEAAVTFGSWRGWEALKAMAPDICRPFSADRKGMVLGEGAATFVLEDWDHATSRGAMILGELLGSGASADAHHLTAPHGQGAVRALWLAHEDAGVEIGAPALISTHGTGTPLNDKTEVAALREVYGERLEESLLIATKSAHGHLIGAGGALELVLGLEALRAGVAPPILNWTGADPECSAPLALEATPIAYDTLVSSSFAFGGLNAVLIARRH